MLTKLATVVATILLLSATAAWAGRNPDLDDPKGTFVPEQGSSLIVAPTAVQQFAPVSIESHRSLDLDP